MATSEDTDDGIEFTTERGADVRVTADGETLWVDVTSDAVNLDTTGHLDTHEGRDVLNCGRHRVGGSRQIIQIPVDDRRESIENLKTDPTTDEPLTYEVVEKEESRPSLDGWGGGTRTVKMLSPSKEQKQRTDRQRELHLRVDTDRIPEEAEVGDVLTFEDLLDDARTADEQDQDALNKAADTGEEVVINESMTDCNDTSKECNLDHVTKVATPEGEIETRRSHTY